MSKPFKCIWLSESSSRDWDSWDFAAYDWRRPPVYGEMAKLLENRGGFEAIVLEDTPFLDADDAAVMYGVGGIFHDATSMLAAVSWYTRHIGLVTTATTSTWPPFMLARALGTLDHLSYGRCGWNIDARYFDELVGNYDVQGWKADQRYDRADEFVAVCKMLWDSWEDDAVLLDRSTGRFADGAKVHETNYEGRYFKVRGPMTLARPPQRYPVLAHTDMSERGRRFIADNADLAIVKSKTPTAAAALCDDVRVRAAAAGRNPDDVKIFYEVCPYVGDSTADAKALRTRLHSTPALLESGMDTIGETLVVEGDPATVAAELEDVVEESGADGLAFRGTMTPTTVVPLVDRVIPLLRQRGLVRTGYRYQDFRDNLMDPDFIGVPNVIPGGIK